MKRREDTTILIYYTGGTIGMIENPDTGALENFGLERFRSMIPEIDLLPQKIEIVEMESVIDSSDMEPQHWARMAAFISQQYERVDGFVILHGTDTMSYTASVLSFMLENLAKPVIITGSQLPLSKLRTDGRENLLTSIEIASARNLTGMAMVPEVCIYFDNRLMRGNRTTKFNASDFDAFQSYNYPVLGRVGIDIHYDVHAIRSAPLLPFKPHFELSDKVISIALFPGIKQAYLEHILSVPDLRAVILRTFGSGNAPHKPWLMGLLKKMCDKEIIVVNNTQCAKGQVQMERYETGRQLLDVGVVNGADCTFEACVTKMMYLLAQNFGFQDTIFQMRRSIAGEITEC